MEEHQSRALRRRRPDPEPGPRLLPVLIAIVVVGFAIGAGAKLLYGVFHHPHAAPVPGETWSPTPTPTATPNYALVQVRTTKLPPIPTPKGTWYVDGAMRPFRVVISPAHSPAASPSPTPAVTPSPSAKPTASAKPSASPKATPTHAPSPVATHSPKPTAEPTVTPSPSPEPTVKIPLKHAHATPHPVKHRTVAVALPTVEPAADMTPVPHVHVLKHAVGAPVSLQTVEPAFDATPIPRSHSHVHIVRTPAPIIEETPSPEPIRPYVAPTTAAVHPSGAAHVVRSYLSAIIRGDERAAYRLLGAAPGDRNASLSEESFINTSARISSVKSGAPTADESVVHAEIETAGGSYFATYHVRKQDGTYVITDHSFIKL